jgi:hypothetical protein
MRIMAVCHNCQRDLLLSQLVEGWGHAADSARAVLDPIRAPLTAEQPPSRPVLRQAA